MKITTRTLFLAFGVFFHSIELICSLKTLAELFPGYSSNHVLPPILRFPPEQLQYNPSFLRPGGPGMEIEPGLTFMARAHIVFGYQECDVILRLWGLLYQVGEFDVFDTQANQWHSLSREEFQKLGIGRSYTLVDARNKVAATFNRAFADPIEQQAHTRACELANRRADQIESVQEKRIQRDMTNIAVYYQGEEAIKEGYRLAYTHAFSSFVQRHTPKQRARGHP